jgi:rubrerythrin
MPELSGSQTEKNLLTAFLGESADQNHYFYYAKIAKKAGYIALSTLFEQTALQERSHAKNFLKHLESGELTITASFNKGPIGANMENLRQALEQETLQYETRYPEFAAAAKEEGFPKIATLFASIAVAEKYHAARFRAFLDAIEQDTVFKSNTKVAWVCTKCGYVHEGADALEKCPACGHPKDYFERTDIL